MWTFVRQAHASPSRSRVPGISLDRRQVSIFATEALRRAVPRTCAIEHLLFTIALVSLGWYAFLAISTAREQAALTRELQRLRFTASASPAGPEPRGLTARLAPGTVIGRIEVPRLKLSALAREGADARTLRTAVGHVPETALPGDIGNAAFAGYRDTFFRNLEGVQKGDEIVLRTASGIHHYVVTATRVVAPTETAVVTPAEGHTLTLVTGYPFDYIGAAPERFIVRAAAVAPARSQ
jgi:sortase A